MSNKHEAFLRYGHEAFLSNEHEKLLSNENEKCSSNERETFFNNEHETFLSNKHEKPRQILFPFEWQMALKNLPTPIYSSSELLQNMSMSSIIWLMFFFSMNLHFFKNACG